MKPRPIFVLARLLALPLWVTVAMPALAVERQTLRGHVPEALTRLGMQPMGRLPATNRLRLAIGLPLRNTNGLNQLLQETYDPALWLQKSVGLPGQAAF